MIGDDEARLQQLLCARKNPDGVAGDKWLIQDVCKSVDLSLFRPQSRSHLTRQQPSEDAVWLLPSSDIQASLPERPRPQVRCRKLTADQQGLLDVGRPFVGKADYPGTPRFNLGLTMSSNSIGVRK